MTTPPRPADASSRAEATRRVWYAAYGSNMHVDRLAYYLAGGRPPGGARTYPGCRDPRRPERMVPVMLPGQLYFALESATWTGGMGFYDPFDPGEMPARAYLLTVSQFSDIAAQEMYRDPGEDLDLSGVLATGRATLGEGRYETLVRPRLLDGHVDGHVDGHADGRLDGRPVLTFTAPWRRAEAWLNRPSAAYLRNLATGLRESHRWSTERIAQYLAARPGAAGQWSMADIAALLAD
ncbi:hypothetical protein ABIA33_003695 [Streptacidiphilus sp. MAP12-16]|uniref:histone deacetylase n=1 Tax=Streptacidiphilus sp. MAP12-16 TaxID=3156300 RepID=UPI0035188A60